MQKQAQTILAEYAAAIIEAQYAELNERVVERAVISEIKSSLEVVQRQNSFWSQVKVTWVSTFFATVILIVLSIAIALFGVDILNGAQKLRQSLGS